MQARVEWRDPTEFYKGLVARRLEMAARHLRNKIRENLSHAGTFIAPYTGFKFRQVAGQYRTGFLFFKEVAYRKGQRIYNWSHSKPGEYPYKQHGLLRMGVQFEIDKDKLVARVGVMGPALKYAKYLELGTKRIKRRSYLRRTLMEEMGQVQQIMAGNVRDTFYAR